jgi:hypothetical protein
MLLIRLVITYKKKSYGLEAAIIVEGASVCRLN